MKIILSLITHYFSPCNFFHLIKCLGIVLGTRPFFYLNGCLVEYSTIWLQSDLTGLLLGNGLPGGSDGKESACNAGDLGLVPGFGRFPGGGHGKSLQHSFLENPHGQRSVAGYSAWGQKESDTTELLSLSNLTRQALKQI